MGDVAIKVEGLGKRYALGAAAPYATLRESIGNLVRFKTPSAKPILWAVKDVSFTVKQGETVGIIGRNGAGKSTLLKMLSRITTPTAGRIEVTGRLASLLEVGTGFHPELTGRENVFLNGGILGMTRPEIRARFDEIVAFAEVESFIDTAVKHYSSGMYLRLAFAVAAHLEPEILVVDEVLAVGDASFQRKCLNKMEDAGRGGRTVLFVSHSMQAVTRLCSRTILLDGGSILHDGPSPQVVASYLRSGLGTSAQRTWSPDKAPGNEFVKLFAVRALKDTGAASEVFDCRESVTIQVDFEVLKGGLVLVPNLHLLNEEGSTIFIALDTNQKSPRPPGRYRSRAVVPGNLLAEGSVAVGVAVSTMNPVHVHASERDAVAFQVVEPMDGDTARGELTGQLPGMVRPRLTWTLEPLTPDGNTTGDDAP